MIDEFFQAEGKAHDSHQTPERSRPWIPKQRRLYVIRTSPEGVEWARMRVDQVQHRRERRRRNGTKTRRGIRARWWKVFLGCRNFVREQETSIRDSTT